MKNIVSLLILGAVGFWVWQADFRQPEKAFPQHNITQQETILSQIRQLNQLNSVSFHLENIIKTEKHGNWYALWQDSQTGIFVVKGQVQAGLNLDKLSAQNIHVTPNAVVVNLPPAEIVSVQLDSVEVFDMKTGLFNVVQADWSVLPNVQTQAKQHILQQACKNNILQIAQQRSAQQITQLLALANVKVSVQPSDKVGACRVA